ncbi:S8 family serine peptidase [Actinoalloteichus caeruleus]|uniref:S8 family serine peptidase n=1 Tax=Actinoalloteichus cyanogriseus TaxID=2893586 RepID=UPI000A5BDBD8|nr:S8 family serine peptidase [Actinoalloteichus caeruleus]
MSHRRSPASRERNSVRTSRGRAGTAVTALTAITAALVVPPAVSAQDDAAGDVLSVDSAVTRALDAKGSSDVWLVLEDRADLSVAAETTGWVERGEAVVSTLRDHAARTQKQVIGHLTEADAEFSSFWISNRVLVRDATRELLTGLDRSSGVSRVTLPVTLDAPEPVEERPARVSVDALEWGVAEINADAVWSDYGVRGEGITVGSIDTGAQYDHPALVDSYRGNLGSGFDHDHNWFDPASVCGSPSPAPCDNNSHGTHVTGTMTGDDGGDNQIGVAPGAQWIAAKGCEANGCTDASLLASGQWMLAPTDLAGENPRADLRPHVVNNSWGASNGPIIDPWYDDVVAAWNASGIFGLFSNGNSGPSCDTAGSPADSRYSYGVGAYGSTGSIASFSSRGPGFDGEIRPHISAPGVSVRSATPNSSYGLKSGTSMAAPHVAGAVALLWSSAPSLVGDVESTRDLLNGSAIAVDDTSCGGTPENNNVWGHGKLDVLAAVGAAPRGDTGVLAGSVTNSATGDPVAGARVSLAGPLERATSADAEGRFSATVSVGEYEVTVSAFGYGESTSTATVSLDETTSLEFELDPVPTRSLVGEVTDARGAPLPGATVVFDDHVLPAVTTDDEGGYAFDAVPEGSYALTAAGSACVEPVTRETVVSGFTRVLNFRLPDVTDEYGHSCRVGQGDYTEGETRLALTGDDRSETVDLPFDFDFYGETYGSAAVSTNGFLAFEGPATAFLNGALPSASAPNAAVYPFWDDLNADANSGIYTRTAGEAPNRTFLVEWRELTFFGSGSRRVDFGVTLHEGGDIVFDYRDLGEDDAIERGASATVGIENASGTVALQFSHNAASLRSGSSITFSLPDSGFVTGAVVDGNDGAPVAGALVEFLQRGEVVSTTRTGDDGTYRRQLPLGYYTVAVSKENYVATTGTAYVGESGERVSHDATLRTSRGATSVDRLEWLLPGDTTREAEITVTNVGTELLTWELTPDPEAGPASRAIGVPWLSHELTSGQLRPGRAVTLGLEVDTGGLAPGVHEGVVAFRTNGGRQAVLRVPVRLVVSAHWQAVNPAGAAHTDSTGIEWVADQAYQTGSFGYLGDDVTTAEVDESVDIRDTREDAVYRSQLVGLEGYRFDALPAGTYELTLGFAELDRSPRLDWRRFDVQLNGRYVLVGHDIAEAVGGLRADEHTTTVTVEEGGSVDLRFLARRGYEPPVLNAVQLVHRPDL